MMSTNKSEYFRRVDTQFQFEDWMIDRGGGAGALAAAFALAEIKDGECIRVSAAQQREIFGKVVFGKKCVRINHGILEVVWSSGFGQDTETNYLHDIT